MCYIYFLRRSRVAAFHSRSILGVSAILYWDTINKCSVLKTSSSPRYNGYPTEVDDTPWLLDSISLILRRPNVYLLRKLLQARNECFSVQKLVCNTDLARVQLYCSSVRVCHKLVLGLAGRTCGKTACNSCKITTKHSESHKGC